MPGPGIAGWIEYRLPIFGALRRAGKSPVPRNLNYWWNFGSIATACLLIQILTGLSLAVHYAPQAEGAFASVEHIMRDVRWGWLLHDAHAVGASLFFAAVYIHMFRGLYYGSYRAPRELLWMLGVVILLLMMVSAFTGYVLPWSQMGFWGATVWANMVAAFPGGEALRVWALGGQGPGTPMLMRFFVVHLLAPGLILMVVLLHVAALRRHGSNNPTGLDPVHPGDSVPFHPYYTVKDGFGLAVFFLVFAVFLFFAPRFFSHPDAYIPADPMVTPAHVMPGWYFLPFYAMLRAVTFDTPLWAVGGAMIGVAGLWGYAGKQRSFRVSLVAGLVLVILGGAGWGISATLGGALVMFAALGVLFFLPWLDTSPVRSARYRPVYRWVFWVFVLDCLLLGYCGSRSPEGVYAWVSLGATVYYFVHFLVMMPLLGRYEKPLPLPVSIGTPVLRP